MESAIPNHLKCPRSRNRRIEDDYVPPYPAWVARSGETLEQVVMGYFGVQWRDEVNAARGRENFELITSFLSVEGGPAYFDRARFTDADGYENLIAIAYWADVTAFQRWRDNPQISDWWNSADRLRDGLGYFREIALPRVERFETLLSKSDRLEGVGVIMDGRSEEIQEHGYWGSMRDRLALSQTDAMVPSGALTLAPVAGQRVRVEGHANLALIRSGQEWVDTKGRERELYEKDMEPVFREGMDFLRDQGLGIGCYCNRYMQHIDSGGSPLEKTFGLSFWRSLSHLERWSEAHPTHVDIFATFMRMVQQLEFQLDLRLYHEVSVLAPDEQEYEYINCHPGTGMLKAAAAVD